MNFFIKNPNLTKKKFWWVGGEGVGVGWGKCFFFKESKSGKKLLLFFFLFFFEGVKVREDWLM